MTMIPTGQVAASDVNVCVGSAAGANVDWNWIRSNSYNTNGHWYTNDANFGIDIVRGWDHFNCISNACNCNCNCACG